MAISLCRIEGGCVALITALGEKGDLPHPIVLDYAAAGDLIARGWKKQAPAVWANRGLVALGLKRRMRGR